MQSPPTERCDCCRRDLELRRGTLRGLCHQCSILIESGKYAARIVVAESKAMAVRAAERRIRR